MDERLRDAERRWRESGLVDDAAAWLVERVRAGRTRRLHLEWLTFLGDEAAARALAGAAPSALPVRQRVPGQESALDPRERAIGRDTTMWAYGLLDDDRDAAVRALLALADRARHAQAPHDVLARRAIAVAARDVVSRSLEAHPPVTAAWPVAYALQWLRQGDGESFYMAFMTGVHALGRAGAVEVVRDALRAWWVEGRDLARELAET